MKKALIAAAVAGAFAAPSVMAADLSTNVYWSTGISMGETTSTTAAAAGGVDSTINNDEVADGGGNRLMFTWTDTLDNGIGVNAYLSFGNLNTAGAGGVNVRNANIGFSGDFGKVQVGTNEHFSETDLLFDPSFGDFGRTGDAISFIQLGQTAFNFTRRDGESVWYTSNDMNGLQFRAVYIMGPRTAAAAGSDQDGTQLGVTYSSGPLTVGASQASYNDYANNGGTSADDASVAGTESTMTSFRATYDMGMVMVKAAVWDIEQSGIVATTNLGDASTGFEVSGQSIFVGMPINGGTLWAQSSSLGDQDATLAAGTSAINASGKTGFDIGYHHAMNSQVNFFLRYGESETEVNFDATVGSTETEELMLGWQLMY